MILAVKVVPASSQDQISGWLGDELKIKVRAQPEKGRANEAVVALLAGLLDLNKSRVIILKGHTGANKLIELSGLSRAELLRKLKNSSSQPASPD